MRETKEAPMHKPEFTDEQWKSLLKFMEKCKITSSEEKLTGMKIHNEWILDLGASYHMTGLNRNLKELTRIPPVAVSLPNGDITQATHVGTVLLSERLDLINVLVVPGLKCNLISLGKLIDGRKCDIFFTNDLCVIQDLPTRTPIGVGERRGGVYYFRSLDRAKAYAVEKSNSSDLWHSQLGRQQALTIE
ncbi:unnamed protein product [Cuscuta europaea]|uniref:Retrovirus-related Pol polyprotein from transposon TNT 1-94-like beta-barrel domain-containing protein n=1 Tax=Cuscuta europaea TaxID=41803 RepID=A0A9P0ZTW2_CUSEU|nr:unnamed protein product [Cuscuta europaea]